MCKRLSVLISFVLVLGLVGNALGQEGAGYLLFEHWMDIGGTAVADLTGQAAYPDSPDDSEWRDRFEAKVDWANDYGTRARGYLYPPEDGDYTLWISGDDFIELYLSTDDDPANAVMIADVPGWTNHLEWDKYAEQQSAPFTLAAGQVYYIEAVMKEGGGGDSLTAGWTGPGIGTDLTIIDGAFLSPFIRVDDPLPTIYSKAQNPVPADGAIEVDDAALEWTAGITAVSHTVYLSTDATVDAADLVGETQLTIQVVVLDPGVTYYWRVDEVEADGNVVEGDVWSFSTLALEAHFPNPADGATDIGTDAQLSWTAGKVVIMHDMYFGTDEAAIAARDMTTFKGKLMTASYDPGELELFATYYWAVDQFTPTGTVAGPVWSFSTAEFIPVEEDETTLNYDNSAEPFLSELGWDVPADVTAGGVLSDVTLRFKGAGSNLSVDEATGTYEVAGSGADVWGSADQFHYVYKELTGDATITAQVVSNGTGSNSWAKGGVMIRETTDPGSKHMIMALTGGDGGGIGFQGRPITGDRSNSFHGDLTASPPYWVRLTREGNTITGYASADGVTWELFTDTSPDGAQTNPIDVEMADPVLIGLFVTSHAAGEIRTFTMDNVTIEGDVSADFVSEDIDSVSGNSAEPVYVALEDASGTIAAVLHADMAATQIGEWWNWKIPLAEFADQGVDLTAAVTLYFGVGGVEAGGAGAVTVDDILIVKPSPSGLANVILVSGNHDFDGDGVVDDFALRDLLEAEGYNVDYQPGNWTELDDDKIAALNAADLVIISRCSNSGDYNSDDEPTQWNSITTPMIQSSTHLMRSSRWKWVDSTSILSLAPAMMDLVDGSQIDAIDEAEGLSSFIDAAPGNGTVLATGDGLPWIMEWEAGVEFYDGAGQTAGGPRVFFVAGTQELVDVSNWGEWNLAPEGEAIYLDVVSRLIGPLDITSPSDNLLGVPNNGNWPGGEPPAYAIDDDTGLKYLHHDGELQPTGFQVQPQVGATVVTGLTLTTANDCAGRDPGSFEIYGSNFSVSGPYDLIASGDVVDFIEEAEWPRFTMNATPIAFANTTPYVFYQVLFPAIRGPVGGCVGHMQIGEVELIGVIPADVTAPGDVVKGVPDEPRDGSVAGWPDGEYPWMATDDDASTKFLHFRGEVSPTGFVVEPAMGATVVTGLTLTTANDATERDPASFELSGSNDSIDGPYELIAAGDAVDFVQEAAWPRFTMNATAISFANDVAYKYYQVMFPTVRDAGSANSMQIAEVELIGVAAGAPSGYAFEGGAPDDTWVHDNGSDQWDGTGPGEGNPGGAVSLTEGDDTFLRIQDTGDPRSLGISEPSNRKVYLTRLTDISLDGLRLEVRMRVATTAPLDNQISGDPWPADGIGYHIRDGGKGMIGVSDGVGIISFSLGQAGEPDYVDAASDVLVMNSLVGTEPTSDVDTGDAANAVALNMMDIADAAAWNTFVIDIVAGGAGTHVVSVSANGGPEEIFDVTLGSDMEADAPFIAIGSSGTGGITAFDVDYLSVQ